MKQRNKKILFRVIELAGINDEISRYNFTICTCALKINNHQNTKIPVICPKDNIFVS